MVKIIQESKYECIYGGQRNASLDDIPQQNPGVSTAIDKVDTFKFPEDDANPFHKLPTLPTLLIPPEMITDNNAENPVNNGEAAKIEEAVHGSNTVDSLSCSTCIFIPPRITKVSFKNKLYSNGTYKDSTVHITVNACHNNDHPSPINQDPYMHLLGIVMLHYSDPDVLHAAFAQSYSFKAGLKKFGKIGEKPPSTNLSNCRTTHHITPSMPNPSPPKNVKRHYLP